MNIKKTIRKEFSLYKRDVLPQIKLKTDGIIKKDYIQKEYKIAKKRFFSSALATATSLVLIMVVIYKYYEENKDIYVLADKNDMNFEVYVLLLVIILLVCLFLTIKHLLKMNKIKKNIKK